MNPLDTYIKQLKNNVPLTYFFVDEKSSRKKKDKRYKKSIKSEIYRTEVFMLTTFHKPISRIVYL